jgi:eukaryotic-like serine/threonine-protein kinase
MGVVYLAERADGQYRRRVAIKRIRSASADDPVHQRFLAERQILAGLDHPSIARLLDGGVTDDGRPYLVLEYVDGMPITAYCDRHRLGVEERLRLFLEVCAAVQHAHRNLVVHRDLKPGNILVTPAGQVRLLDFGIAKLLNPTLSGASAPVTRLDLRAMTPEYASPEQVQGDSLTTASDVYSLGVLLYELLTGSSPYRLSTRSPAEIVRAVCDLDPEPPSTRVAEQRARRRRRAPPPPIRRPRGRRVDRTRRWRGSPGRCRGRPRLHRADGAAQGAGPPVRLGRPAAPGAESMSALAALLTRLGEYEAAQHLLEEALRLDSLLLGREHPAVAADLSQLAVVLRERGDYEGAERRHLQALRTLRRGAEDDPRLAAMATELVATLERAGDHAAAEHRAREAVELHRRLSGDTHPALASALSALGLLLQRRGGYAEAETLFREAYGIAVRALGEEHPETAELVQRLASIRWWQGDYAAADSLHRESLRLKRRLYGDRHVEVAVGLNNLASVLRDTRRYDEAEAAHREALEIVRAQLGEEHLRYWAMLANHAMTLTARGDCEPAVRMMEASIAGLRRTAPRDRSRIARQQRWLGACLTGMGRFEEAEAVLLESYSALLALREDDRFAREAAEHLADLYTAWGKPAKAEEYGIASRPSSRR